VPADPSVARFRRIIQTSYAYLDARRDEVNDLNVYPVADGDTGDNMALTMRAVLAELDRIEAEEGEEADRAELVHAVARAALMGARGNSGVILSQIVRGAAQQLATRPGDLIDPLLIASAFSSAADAAYESVRDPAEGTMLTVIRAMSNSATIHLTRLAESDVNLDADLTPEQQDQVLAAVLEVVTRAGFAAGQQDAAQVPGGDHHVDGRVGPPGDLDGLSGLAPGLFQAAACAFDLGPDGQRRAGPGSVADRPQHAERLLGGRVRRSELPTAQLNRGAAEDRHRLPGRRSPSCSPRPRCALWSPQTASPPGCRRQNGLQSGQGRRRGGRTCSLGLHLPAHQQLHRDLRVHPLVAHPLDPQQVGAHSRTDRTRFGWGCLRAVRCRGRPLHRGHWFG